jgi:hypothetical protein
MLKKAGRLDESARVRGLAKPSYTAWLVNQLYWNARDLLEAFLKASDRVRAAEQAMLEGRKAAGHAESIAARTAALDQLMARASTRAAEEGTPLSPALGERLKTTLEAIGAFGAAEARHARGRLQEDLDPPGFAAFAALASMAKPAPGGARKPAPPLVEPPRLVVGRSLGLDNDARQAAADARAALHEAQAAAARAQDASTAAAEAERKARAAAEAAKARLIEVQRAVKSAEAEVAATAAALKARRDDARKAAAAAAAAQKSLDQVRQPRRH